MLEQPSDVLRQFCHGDLEAFEALFRQHQGAVYGWIVCIVRDPAAAEDLTIADVTPEILPCAADLLT